MVLSIYELDGLGHLDSLPGLYHPLLKSLHAFADGRRELMWRWIQDLQREEIYLRIPSIDIHMAVGRIVVNIVDLVFATAALLIEDRQDSSPVPEGLPKCNMLYHTYFVVLAQPESHRSLPGRLE